MSASALVVVSLIVGIAGFVGGIANAIYWKRHPSGYVYGLLGRKRRGRTFWI